MTVESTTRKQIFAGAQDALTFSFRTLANHPEYIKVKNTLIATGVETDLTYNVDYTVALEADGTGGVVTVAPTFSASYNHTVYRETDDTQESDYDDFNQFPSDTIENDLDRRTLISQERADDVDRTAKAPISYTGGDISLPNPQDGYSLVWSGSTGKLINSNLTGSTGAIGPTGPTGPSGGGLSLVTSSTTDLTVSITGGTAILTVVAATGGANKILKLDGSGFVPTGALSGLLGLWNAVISASTVYLAATDLFLTGYGTTGTVGAFTVKTDGSNPPTTARYNASNQALGSSMIFPIYCYIKKGDYYKVEAGSSASTIALYVIPLGV